MAMTMAEAVPWDPFVEGCDQTFAIPDIMEYVVSKEYLGRSNIYPRQATLLKVFFLQEELFTPYDHRVINEWAAGFSIPSVEHLRPDEPVHYVGNHGMPPDVLDRIRLLREQDRRWFNEILNVTGRRGSKGYIGGLGGSYVLWHYLQKGNPQDFYGVDPDKKLGAYVFAGKREQAKANQWRDLVNVILASKCFEPYVAKSINELLTIQAPADKDKQREYAKRGIKTDLDLSTFEVVPKEATLMAGRGPALFMIFFDEMAHVIATGANRSAEEIYEAATPALDQFGVDAFKYAGSSPWQMMGKFYELCQQALEIEEVGKDWVSVYPEKLLVQLTSWDPYEDWKEAFKLPLVPEEYAEKLAAGEVPGRKASNFHLDLYRGVRRFKRIKRPIQQYDENMAKLERANPATFAVERRCLDPNTRVLRADLTWCAIKDLVEGDEVVSVDEEPEAGKERKMRTATVVKKWSNVDRAYRITFEDGTSVTCSANHRWLSGSGGSPASYRWRHLFAGPNDPGPRQIIKPGDSIRYLVDPWEKDESWESGYLAGVFDGEGTFSARYRGEWKISFPQNPGETLDATLAYWRSKGFAPQHVPMLGNPRKCQTHKIVGFANCLRFIGVTGSHKLRRQALAGWEGLGLPKLDGKSSHKIIASIEELPEQELIDIETTAGTFIAEGLVSHNSHWATAQDAYLNPLFVDEMFRKPSWMAEPLVMQIKGQLKRNYAAHGDPSKSGANFGWAVAHTEGPDDKGLLHVVFDKIHHWTPVQWEDGRQDYFAISEEILDDIRNFMPGDVTFDQFNSFMLMAHLRKEVYKMKLPKRIQIEERTATRTLNWSMAECFKTALGMKLIHAPGYEQAEMELKFLQEVNGRVDHPTMGPIQTKDVADAMFNVVWALIGDQMAAFVKGALSSISLRASSQDDAGNWTSPSAARDAEVMQQFAQFERARGVRPGVPRPGNMPIGGRAIRRRT